MICGTGCRLCKSDLVQLGPDAHSLVCGMFHSQAVYTIIVGITSFSVRITLRLSGCSSGIDFSGAVTAAVDAATEAARAATRAALSGLAASGPCEPAAAAATSPVRVHGSTSISTHIEWPVRERHDIAAGDRARGQNDELPQLVNTAIEDAGDPTDVQPPPSHSPKAVADRAIAAESSGPRPVQPGTPAVSQAESAESFGVSSPKPYIDEAAIRRVWKMREERRRHYLLQKPGDACLPASPLPPSPPLSSPICPRYVHLLCAPKLKHLRIVLNMQGAWSRVHRQ